MQGAAGQPPESIVYRLTVEAGGVRTHGQATDPGPPRGPEHAPHFGRVRAVHLQRAVRGGGPLVAAHRPWLVCRRTGIDEQWDAVYVHQATEGVSMRMTRQRRRAWRADVGEQMPAARHRPHQSRVGHHEQRAVRGRTRRECGDKLAVDRVAVVQQRHPPVGGEHCSQPAAHPVHGCG